MYRSIRELVFISFRFFSLVLVDLDFSCIYSVILWVQHYLDFILARLFFFLFYLFVSWGSRSARPWGWLFSAFFFLPFYIKHATVGHTGLCTFSL